MSYRRLPPASRPGPSSAGSGSRERPVDIGWVWGKSAERLPNGAYPLIAHLLDSAGCILALEAFDSPVLPRAALRGLGADGATCLALLAALHDLGKATTGFAARDLGTWRCMWRAAPPSAGGAATGHARPGQASAVLEEWPAMLSGSTQPLGKSEAEELRQFIGLVIGAHHGRITSAMSRAEARTALEEARDGAADWVAFAATLPNLCGRP
ncbi:CRISPR-associated endonuclease Cas3'' [Allosalinactinospora lopnorensis]|uniref:CRISPR-associated endonuclease Cas3'' n=1 Tax=Allosalinactinospora lopnorensis TaxID=1352348 RepID=UPI0012E304E5